MTRFSIIIPCYNAEEFIPQLFESITSQDYTNLQIIAVDDGSTDNTPAMIKRFMKKDSRIQFVQQANQGQSVARNQGLDMANGDYISFIDSDDWIGENMYHELNEIISGRTPDVVVFSHYKEPEQKRVSLNLDEHYFGKVVPVDRNLFFRKKSGVQGPIWNKVYKRSVIEDNKIRFLPELRKGQDGVFNLHFFTYARTIYFYNKFYYHYRYNPDSTVHKYRKNKLGLFLQHYLVQNQILNEWQPLKGKHLYRRYMSLLEMTLHCYHNEFHDLSKKSFLQKIKAIREISLNKHVQRALRGGMNRVFNGMPPERRLILIFIYFKLYPLVGLLYSFSK